jgi:para-aminobenzoate synthetase component I
LLRGLINNNFILKNVTPNKACYHINDFESIKQKVLNWAQQFSTFCFLDNHHYQTNHTSLECVLAAGVKRFIKADAGTALKQLQAEIDKRNTWLFGHLGYDLKNETEQLSTTNPDKLLFPDLYFFEPEILIHLSQQEIIIEAINPEKIWKQLQLTTEPESAATSSPLSIQSVLNKQEYIRIIEQLQQHIRRGDCYEINFCQEFFSKEAVIDPLAVYIKLSSVSPNPFSALYRVDDKWLICASPERFLRKEGAKILSQPIKGTSKRELYNEVIDEQNRIQLQQSEKDKSENVMVVDLVRNDLAKVCEEGTVQVDELFGVYSFPQVHQMISTISGIVKSQYNFAAIIRATFPMGSMTGAPKLRVMGLIEQYEKTKRGIFAGAVGYISPTGDFDFNVVIRSIMYNATTQYLSFQAGSGITFYSNPESEWEECMLKAAAMKNVLTSE